MSVLSLECAVRRLDGHLSEARAQRPPKRHKARNFHILNFEFYTDFHDLRARNLKVCAGTLSIVRHERRLRTTSAKDELVKLATRLIVEEALEGEAGDAVGRDYYEHGAQPGQGYRNGYRMGRLKTAEGAMEYSAPQIAGRDEPFRSAIREHLKAHTQGLEDLAIEMLARGLSVRDIEDAFRDENGRLLLSKAAVSQLGERLWEDYQTFAERDLGEYEIMYLFIDGIAERLRPGAKREPVLAAWGFTIEGRRVLLHMMAGSKEDAETVTAFFEDMKRRGLNDQLRVTSDGAHGSSKAVGVCFPR